MSNSRKVRFIAISAVVAAMYAGLTYLAAAVNLAYGPVQFRFSEALTVLPAFTPAAVPGLALGCFARFLHALGRSAQGGQPPLDCGNVPNFGGGGVSSPRRPPLALRWRRATPALW